MPIGITKVEGSFGVGDPVECVSLDGKTVGIGLANYRASEIEKIRGKKSSEIEAILGFKYSDEVIHRDNFAVSPEAMDI